MIKHVQLHFRLFAIAIILSVGLLAFHYSVGTPRGASFDYNLSWYEAFRSAFWQGDLYPRFAPELWFGNGGLDFLFYGPLPFWFASVMGEISCPGCSTSQAFSVSGAWMLILSGITFFIFAKRFFAPAWAGFGAIVYVLLPFHYLINWYIGQTIGAMMALAILPILALAVSQLIDEKKGGLLFALSFAALALSHLPTTLIVVHLLVVLVLWTVFTREKTWPKRLALISRFIPWGLLGVALSAFYWLPAIALLDSVSSDMLYSDYYDSTQWLFLDGQPENDPTKTPKFKHALLLAVVVTVGARLIFRRAKDPSTLIMWVVIPTAFTAFLMTVFSYPVWKFWIINKVQFPDRTLIVTDLSVALAAIVIARSLVSAKSVEMAVRLKLIAAAATCVLFVALLVPLKKSAEIIRQGAGANTEFLAVAPAEYVPPTFLALAMDRYSAHDFGEMSNADRFYVFFDAMEAGFELAGNALQHDAPGATLTMRIQDRVSLSVDLAEPRDVRVPIPSWQYWRAETAGGAPLPLSNDPDLGILQVALPAGQTEIEFYLIETPPQRIGSLISLLALSMMVLFYLVTGLRSHRRVEKPLSTSLS